MQLASTVIPHASPDLLRLVLPYRITGADQKFRQRIRQERGNKCERCGASGEKVDIQCHLMLDARVYPQFAKEPANVIVVCERCQSLVASAQVWERQLIQEFYGGLPAEVRRRVVEFLEEKAPQLRGIIEVCGG
jgi:hypothetical protein